MAPVRPRVRSRRLLLLLGLVLLLGLLLELNRFLPGGWPGGGEGGGFRTLDVAGGSRGDARDRLRSPDAPSPDWTPAQGIKIEVRGPDGQPVDGWRAGVGTRGALDGPGTGSGTLFVGDRDVTTQGVRVQWPGGLVRHVPPPDLPPAPTWSVHLPAARVPALLQPHEVVVEVREAGTDAPLAGAEVRAAGRSDPVRTDANGAARLAALADLTPVTVSAEGFATERAHVHPGMTGTLRVTLSRTVRLAVRLVDSVTRAEVPVTGARLLDAVGRELWRSEPGPARALRVDAEVPAVRLEGARLVVDAPGRPVTEVEVSAATTEVALAPAGRRLELVLRDAQGAEVRGRAATVRPGAGGGSPSDAFARAGAERHEADSDGRLRVTVPASGEATVVVETNEHAPVPVRVDAGDSAGSRDVTLAPGLRVLVRVLDARGRPVRDAEVVARTAIEGVQVERRATTDAEGRARVGPLPAGPLEVFAHAPGRAWGATAAEASGAMKAVEVRLFPGARLALVVESPLGVPLEGVHVTATPADDGPPDAQPPGAIPWRTDAHGRLVVEDLPQRPYRLRLGLPGHSEEVLHDVRPGNVTYFATLVPQTRR